MARKGLKKNEKAPTLAERSGADGRQKPHFFLNPLFSAFSFR